jgi:hypothetical protein
MEKNRKVILLSFLIHWRVSADLSHLSQRKAILDNSMINNKDKFFNTNFLSKLEYDQIVLEMQDKTKILNNINHYLNQHGYSTQNDDSITTLFYDEFIHNKSLINKLSFIMELVSYPIYAENGKIKYKEHTKKQSFEKISKVFGFDETFLSEVEDQFKETIKSLNPTYNNIYWILGLGAVFSIVFPIAAIALSSNVGITSLSGPVIMSGLAAIGGTTATVTGTSAAIMGVSVLGILSFMSSYSLVKITEHVRNKNYVKLIDLSSDQLKAEAIKFLVSNAIYKKFETNDSEIKEFRKIIIEAFLEDKKTFESYLLKASNLDKSELEKAELISKITLKAIRQVA